MDKMPDKHVLQKRSRKHDNKLHIETCCDFFIKYLYMKGSSKKQRVSFLGRFLLRNEKMLVYRLKNRGRLIHGIDLYSGKYGRSVGLFRNSSPSYDTLNFLVVVENFSFLMTLKLIATSLKLISWRRCLDHQERSIVLFSCISPFPNVDDLSTAIWISGLEIQSLFALKSHDTKLSLFMPSLLENISSNSFIAVSSKIA